jgi:type I restriction enzyme S subunit
MSRPDKPLRYLPYPKYKDSGVEWIDDIPINWYVNPLFTIAREREVINIGNFEKNVLSLSYGKLIDRDVSDNFGLMPDSFETYQVVKKGNIILRLTDLQNDKRSLRVGLAERQGIITSAYVCLDLIGSIASLYCYYLLHSYDLTKVFYSLGGGVRQTIKFQDLKWLPILIPSKDEQRAIAAFLDRETAKIDALVANNEKLIELLQEKRAAIITQAVTKGLDPTVPIKDSGVEWLGKIPAHWKTKRLKYLTTINDETLREDTDPDLEILYVDIANVDSTKGITDKEKIVFEKAPSRARRIVKDGDVIVSTVRTYLRAIAPIKNAENNLIVSTGFAVIRPRKILTAFASYLFCSNYFVDQVVSNSFGVSYPAINESKLACFNIAYSTEQEQNTIADFLDRETAKIDALVEKIQKGIALLKEYRSALISAAVTGKIDVRGEI